MTLQESVLRAKLAAAKNDLRLRRKAYNSAQRQLQKTLTNIVFLENRLEQLHLANAKRSSA
jgi:hypothetical protein